MSLDNTFSSTILADLAANVLAVFLLILIILLASGSHRAAEPHPPLGSIEAREEFYLVEHATLDARAVVEHLRARLANDGGLVIDLFSNNISSFLNGARVQENGLGGLAAALNNTDKGHPVRLYVFDARHYASTVDAIRALGLSFVEISVPRALRSTDRDGWSPAFASLRPQAAYPELFRTALAHLLDGGVASGRKAATGAAAPSQFSPSERLRKLLGAFAGVAIPLLTFAAILIIETREWRRLTFRAGEKSEF